MKGAMSNLSGFARSHERWARFRFSVIGPLLAAPPDRGELQEQLKSLTCKFHNLSVRSLVSICRRFDCGNKSPESLIGSRFVTRRGFHPGSRTLEVLTLAN